MTPKHAEVFASGGEEIKGILPKEHPQSKLFQAALATISRGYGIEPPQVELFSDTRAFYTAYYSSAAGARDRGKTVEQLVEKRLKQDARNPPLGQTAVIRDSETSSPRYLAYLRPAAKDGEKDYAIAAEAAHAVHGKIGLSLDVEHLGFISELFDNVEPLLLLKSAYRDTKPQLDRIRIKARQWDFRTALDAREDRDHAHACHLAEKLITRFILDEDLRSALLLISTNPAASPGEAEEYIGRVIKMSHSTLSAAANRRRQLLGMNAIEDVDAFKKSIPGEVASEDPEIGEIIEKRIGVLKREKRMLV